MKIEDVKHNHSLTDLLKILLFAILMLAPIASVATRCLYVVCNKNAYQSYSDEIIEVSTQITQDTQYQFGAQYNVNYIEDNSATSYSKTIYFSELSFDPEEYNFPNLNYTNFRFRNDGYIYLADSNGNTTYKQIWGTTLKSFTYYSVQQTFNSNSWTDGGAYFYLMTYKTEKLDNVFEYSVSQLENDQLFSWTENTLIYTGINNMCTQLNITIAAIPMILTYWLMLTCIYVIIDIVLKLFTLLTHMIGNRKA